MSVDFSYLIAAFIVIHTAVLATLTFSVRRARDNRTRILWKLLLIEMLILPVVFSTLYFLQPPTSWLTAGADVVYAMVIAFVLGVEVPGFVLLTRFDEGVADSLEELRRDLVTLGYSFDHLQQLKVTAERSKKRLRSAQVDNLLSDFLAACDRIKNLDRNFWGLVLSEVTIASRFFTERSKHPFPKLIDVLSLAGLSFLLAQFLRLFG